ncbi:hypothetical protein D3C78_1315630 [compost metagenome]
MQAGDDQQAVEHAEDERTNAATLHHQRAEAVDAVLDRRPDIAEHHAQAHGGEPGDNRHEPSATEEGQVFRQLDVLEAVVQRAGHQAADDPGEHAHVDARVEHLEGGDHHQVADHPGKPRRTVVVLGETDRDADGEDHRQVGEDHLAGVVDDRDVQQVGIAQAQQQAGNRQDRDRQHQRAAEALQAFDEKLVHGGSPWILVVL